MLYFIPDESYNTKHLLTYTENQISELSDPFPSLVDLLEIWVGLKAHGGKSFSKKDLFYLNSRHSIKLPQNKLCAI